MGPPNGFGVQEAHILAGQIALDEGGEINGARLAEAARTITEINEGGRPEVEFTRCGIPRIDRPKEKPA